jgi:predicted esterase
MVSQAGQTPSLASSDQTLHHPRILCLHGGGSNGDIFRAQARVLIRNLPDFRLVFANAPFECAPGPGIVPVYKDWGPFRRWLRWLPEHIEIDDELAAEEVLYNIDVCKRRDAGDGPWVGMIGFSQGAKLAASLLYDQQIRTEKEGKVSTTNYKFAALLAGRSPLVSFSEHSKHPALASAGAGGMCEEISNPYSSPHVLSLPTIHVHGLNDDGLFLHRKMLEQYHDKKSVTVIEWDGTHRVPIKNKDVERITKEIYRVAREQGVQLPGEEWKPTRRDSGNC